MGNQVAVVHENNGSVIPLGDLEKMAQYMVKSGLFGIKTQEQAVALMLISQAEGLHPAIAARDFHIIQGRHSLKADAMLARFQTAGGIVEWVDYTNERVSAYFSHPSSPKKVLIDWDMKRAKEADLGNKDNWKKYPRQMLRARVISEGIRTVFPGIAVGVYTPEEVQDFDDAPASQQRPRASQVSSLKDKLKPKETQEQPPIDAEIVDNPFLSEAQAKDIASQCKKVGIKGEDLLSAFGVSRLRELRESQLHEVYDWILSAGKE
jgi:hypothetical protein